jgi:epoxyqueuosine reductase
MSRQPSEISALVKQKALLHGFAAVGISRATFMPEETERLKSWLDKGYHGEMGYMENHFDLRTDPTRLVPGAQSVISLMYNYFPGQTSPSDYEPEAGQDKSLKISRYAYGEDYHKVIRRKLKALVADMKQDIGDFHSRVFVDSAPVLERDWAKRSGLGWIGRNTLLIHPRMGSYFFLAEIILDVEMAYDEPMRDHCGTCTKCVDACPTDAILPGGYELDASKCISYLTIELKDDIPDSFHKQMAGWIFGCDICQEVCPWNRFSTPHEEPAFLMSDEVKNLRESDWIDMTEEIFHDLFGKTPLKRAGLEKLKSTISIQS